MPQPPNVIFLRVVRFDPSIFEFLVKYPATVLSCHNHWNPYFCQFLFPAWVTGITETHICVIFSLQVKVVGFELPWDCSSLNPVFYNCITMPQPLKCQFLCHFHAPSVNGRIPILNLRIIRWVFYRFVARPQPLKCIFLTFSPSQHGWQESKPQSQDYQ